MENHRNELTLFQTTRLDSECPQISQTDAERLAFAKIAYATGRVPVPAMGTLITGDVRPRAGDLVLARIERLGQQARVEIVTGRRARLYVGDEIVVCYGNRYAPDQFESLVPHNLGPCHLVAAGGIASNMLSRHKAIKAATSITPVGLIGDQQGRTINLADWALPRRDASEHPRPFSMAVVGTAMNAGKTTSAAHLIRGLSRAGLAVGAGKVTGTGAGGDRWFMTDSGAVSVFDLTDAGHASTYGVQLPELEEILTTLTGHLQGQGCEAIVLEAADGLFQTETAALLKSPVFADSVDGVVFAAGDAMVANCGVEWLTRHGLPVLAVTGALTASPLACREVEQATGLPVLGLQALSDPSVTATLAARLSAEPALPARVH